MSDWPCGKVEKVVEYARKSPFLTIFNEKQGEKQSVLYVVYIYYNTIYIYNTECEVKTKTPISQKNPSLVKTAHIYKKRLTSLRSTKGHTKQFLESIIVVQKSKVKCLLIIFPLLREEKFLAWLGFFLFYYY